MNILIIGGTQFFGIPTVKNLLNSGHSVTVATRGLSSDHFGADVKRIIFNLYDYESCKRLKAKSYDVVIDKITYSSNEIKRIIDNVDCGRLIHMSTANVYELFHFGIREDEFDARNGEILWCDRLDATYEINKQNSERVLFQCGLVDNYVTVRYPVVLGRHDYTERLNFYVEHILNHIPMYVDNKDASLCFINEDEAGEFIAFLTQSEYVGAVNGCSYETISIRELISYIEYKTGEKAVLSDGGEVAPYNGISDNSLSTEIAGSIGYKFSSLKSWLYQLLDYYIEK